MERIVELLDSIQYRDDQTAVVHRKKLEKLLLRSMAEGMRRAGNLLHSEKVWDEKIVRTVIQTIYAQAGRIEEGAK